MAKPGEFVLQNMMMGPEVYVRQPEFLIVSRMMLLLTKHFSCLPIPFPVNYTVWSTKPLGMHDAKEAKQCVKTGLWVPLHAQAFYEGKCYDRRWVPVPPRLRPKHYMDGRNGP